MIYQPSIIDQRSRKQDNVDVCTKEEFASLLRKRIICKTCDWVDLVRSVKKGDNNSDRLNCD